MLIGQTSTEYCLTVPPLRDNRRHLGPDKGVQEIANNRMTYSILV